MGSAEEGVKQLENSGKKNSININFWSGFPADIPDPYAQMPRGRKVSPRHRGRRKTHFLVRTSTIFGADVHDPKGCRKVDILFWCSSSAVLSYYYISIKYGQFNSGCLLAFHLCLHLLLVHLAHLSVLGRPPPHHLEDRDRPPQFCGVHHCAMFLLALHLALHLSHLHHGFHLQPAWLPQSHLEPPLHQLHVVQHRLNIILEIFNINNYHRRHTSFFKHIMFNIVYFNYINYINYILASYLDIKNSIRPTTTVIQIILFSYTTTFNSSISYILLLISDLNSMQLIKSIH